MKAKILNFEFEAIEKLPTVEIITNGYMIAEDIDLGIYIFSYHDVYELDDYKMVYYNSNIYKVSNDVAMDIIEHFMLM